NRLDAARLAHAPHLHFARVPQLGKLPVAEAVLLGVPQQIVANGVQAGARPQAVLHLHDVADIVQEPAVDLGALVDLVDRHARLDGVADVPDALRIGRGQLGKDLTFAGLIRRAPQILVVAADAEAPRF